jgi:hypothetical protein
MLQSLCDDLKNKLKTNPSLENNIIKILDDCKNTIYYDSISKDLSWCILFLNQDKKVMKIYEILKYDPAKVKSIILGQFKIPDTAYMWGNPYYLILLLLIVYGLQTKNDIITENSLILILTKIWNGRLKHYFPKFCDPDVMRYVISNLSKRQHFKKYKSPIELIINRMCPKLLDKYGQHIAVNPLEIKRLFDQSWNRMYEYFIQDKRLNLKTGSKEVFGGIVTKYNDAYKKGLRLSVKKAQQDAEEIDSIEMYNSSEHNDIIENITNTIIMDITPKYDRKFIDFLMSQSNISNAAVSILTKSIHNINYYDQIREIIELIFSILKITDRYLICSPDFLSNNIKSKIISSKHTPLVMKLKLIADEIVKDIFENNIPERKWEDFLSPIQGQFRKIVIYTIAYNIQKNICSNVQIG